MSELDAYEVVLDRHGTAHAVALTRKRSGAVVGWNAVCGAHVERGEDRTWLSDCEACAQAIRIMRSRRDTERRAAEKRRLAVEAAEQALNRKRRR